MSKEQWSAVDDYFNAALVPREDALEEVLRVCDKAGLPPYNVAPNQGKLLHLLARSIGARRVLEVGTLGAYSTIWLARALPEDGRVITLEYEPTYAEVARANLARVGLSQRVDVRVGAALETLPRLQQEGGAPFDFVFIDADKTNNANYFEWAIKLSRPGAMIVVDNVVRDGAVIDASSTDKSVQGTQRLVKALQTETRVDATALQTVGSKGYDGFILAMVK